MENNNFRLFLGQLEGLLVQFRSHLTKEKVAPQAESSPLRQVKD